MAIGPQALAVDPGVRQGVDDLLLAAAQQLRGHRRAGDFHEQHVVQADPIEAVLQRQHALDLVGLDHGGQHVAHGQRRLAARHAAAADEIGHGEDGAQVVGRMAPLGGQPGIVEVEPAHQRADVEGGLLRVEHERRAGHAAPCGTMVPGTSGPSSFVQAG